MKGSGPSLLLFCNQRKILVNTFCTGHPVVPTVRMGFFPLRECPASAGVSYLRFHGCSMACPSSDRAVFQGDGKAETTEEAELP